MKAKAKPDHRVAWWALKVALGVALIAGIIARFGFGLDVATWSVPTLWAQSVVVLGGGIYILHFTLLRKQTSKMQTPDVLVQSGGLFSVIRHPMYFADIIYYAGMAMLWPSSISLALWLVAVCALERQAREEDRWCAQRFGDQHQRWSSRTRLLIPYLY